MLTYFTSESVCKGHPDKICDIIADSILDAAIAKNPYCHNAVEATIKDTTVFIYGETDTPVDYETIAKQVIKEIGYEDDFEVILRVSEQSPEINNAVNKDEEIGAGDQGIVFGYACNETRSLMPLSIMLSHEIAKNLDYSHAGLRPDGKTQVTVAYDDQGKIDHIDTILVSKQHAEDMDMNELEDVVITAIHQSLFDLDVARYYNSKTKLIINPSGRFTIGGPKGDSGTTGRKIVVDTYGGHGRVGGGCFSSKDPTKVDRSAAYYARYIAKNIVARKYAEKCEVQISYGIGLVEPISLHINCYDTNIVDMSIIYEYVQDTFDCRPSNIIKELGLRQSIYKDTASYGHFGHPQYPWERIL